MVCPIILLLTLIQSHVYTKKSQKFDYLFKLLSSFTSFFFRNTLEKFNSKKCKLSCSIDFFIDHLIRGDKILLSFHIL